MHSSIARAGVQWNIPVESYLKNASDLLVYFSPWNDVNDNDDGYNFEIQLFLIQMTVQTFLNSIHDWYSDQSNVLEKRYSNLMNLLHDCLLEINVDQVIHNFSLLLDFQLKMSSHLEITL